MATGTVTVWKDDRGYGFIARDDSHDDIFCHIRDTREGRAPQPGQRVQFEIGTDSRSGRSIARDVVIINNPQPA